MTPDELLTTTRAVRRRLDLTRPVPLALIEECLRVAQQAPCGSGRHSPHWIVVRDPGTRAEIGRLYRDAQKEYLAEAAPGRSLDSARHLAAHLSDVPALVVACLETGGPLPADNQATVWGSLLPAVWSYQLAARSRGLGTVWTTGCLRHEKELADLLAIPPGVHQGALIPTAYHRGHTFHPASRPPLSLHVDRWSATA